MISAARGGLGVLSVATTLGLAAALSACGGKVVVDGPGGDGGAGTTSSSSGTTTMPPALVPADKVDLLLVVDNSRSMGDKQQILAKTLPDVLLGLVSPRCIDGKGTPVAQPQSPQEACPAGSKREFVPVSDLHIGLISTSLGGHGSDACAPTETQSCGAAGNPTNNDAGHLLSRAEACGPGSVPTYAGKGFLAWDPQQKLNPPGEATIGTLDGAAGLVPSLRDMVSGVGQVGCGYESQLESWYRFLVDPEPYQSISVQGGKATPSGSDSVLLQQRGDFLRPDSMVIIVMLTDENDCSIKEFGQFFYAAQQRSPADPKKPFRLPRARAECAQNPNDPCCKSCGQNPNGCPPDPACAAMPTLSDLDDDINLRCFDQKRRFGIDFLYPTQRYVDALQSPTVQNRQGDLVTNPLFAEMGASGPTRDPGLVFLLGIVGVPWQDLARDPKIPAEGFKTAKELAAPVGGGGPAAWTYIIGDPANYVAPKDPHMIESILPRKGQNPITGDTLAPPGSSAGADGINGHEYTIDHRDDLQYACVFALPEPKDCAKNQVACDCSDPKNDNPLCDPMQPTLQVRAKAYPGIRELSVLQGLGGQGVTASVCPVQIVDGTQSNYGYRPAVDTLLTQIRDRLPQP
jgi:hypothetical protein